MGTTSNLASFVPIVLIALTSITSYIGLNNAAFFDRYKFNVGAILGNSKQWDRLITSAFLHGGYMHLIFNMMTLYFFSETIIMSLGVWQFMAIYFASILSGGLLSLWIHRRHFYYSAIGASGGVVGVLFASIALYPHASIYIFLIPFPIPGWIFGIIYLMFSIYSMRSGSSGIGHEAHLGGAFAGLVLALVFAPSVLVNNALYIGLMMLPLIYLGYYVWKNKN